jgi:hypothetical protein
MRSALIELLSSPGLEVVSDAGIWHAPRNILWYSPHHPLRREQTRIVQLKFAAIQRNASRVELRTE